MFSAVLLPFFTWLPLRWTGNCLFSSFYSSISMCYDVYFINCQILGSHQHRLHSPSDSPSNRCDDRHCVGAVGFGVRGAFVRMEGPKVVRSGGGAAGMFGVTGYWLPDICNSFQFLCTVAGHSGAVLADIPDGTKANKAAPTGPYAKPLFCRGACLSHILYRCSMYVNMCVCVGFTIL